METMLWIWFGLACLAIVSKLVVLGGGDYPRRISFSRGEDAFSVFLQFLILGTIWIVLH